MVILRPKDGRLSQEYASSRCHPAAHLNKLGHTSTAGFAGGTPVRAPASYQRFGEHAAMLAESGGAALRQRRTEDLQRRRIARDTRKVLP